MRVFTLSYRQIFDSLYQIQSGDHFAQEHKTRVRMSSVSTKKKIYQS